ncbi:hypothetical protein, partial [Burkholderia pseudomallei]
DRRMTNLREAVRTELADDRGARLASADAASGFGLEA